MHHVAAFPGHIIPILAEVSAPCMHASCSHRWDPLLRLCTGSRRVLKDITLKVVNPMKWLQVVLTLKPHGGGDLREVTLKREKIKINPVASQLCSSPSISLPSETSQSAEPPAASTGKIGYIRVATFSKQTPDNARSALQRLKADGADRFAPAPLLGHDIKLRMHHTLAEAMFMLLRCTRDGCEWGDIFRPDIKEGSSTFDLIQKLHCI